ncbi:YppG family protein [Halobacillus sp. H74]|uniref:YppG family protein n=1 Tax=Halobacillus sp. H74 TaxID=3457436 RepID=UPI003FCCB2BD
MYPYYPYWNGWYRYPANPAYDQTTYQQMYPNPQANVMGYDGYSNGMYAYQYPYMNSYNYPGYTETGNPNQTNPNASFNVGSIPKGVMNYFQDEEGQMDFDKMMSTTGQVMKTFKQVSPLVKGIGTFVKGIK